MTSQEALQLEWPFRVVLTTRHCMGTALGRTKPWVRQLWVFEATLRGVAAVRCLLIALLEAEAKAFIEGDLGGTAQCPPHVAGWWGGRGAGLFLMLFC